MLLVHPSVCEVPFKVLRLRAVYPGDFVKAWRSLPPRIYRSATFTLTLPPTQRDAPPPLGAPPQEVLIVRDENYNDWAIAEPDTYFLVLGPDRLGRSDGAVVNAIWVDDDIPDTLERSLRAASALTYGFSDPRFGRFSLEEVRWIDPGFSSSEKAIIQRVVRTRPSLEDVLTPGDPQGWTYRSTKGDHILRRNVHKGQRKLFCAELDFLTQAYLRYPELRNRTVRVLYVGAAPGIHIPYLSKLFPKIYWILVDPGEFILRGHVPGKVLTSFFASEKDIGDYPPGSVATAESFSNIDFMINDVRNIREDADYLSGGVEKFIKEDQADAIKWLQIVKPTYGASLKNRHPYDVSKAKTIRGDVRMQVWAPQSSTETRNFIWVDEGESPEDRYEDLVDVDVKAYEDWCAYYNYCLRGWVKFGEPSESGCGTCLDCVYEERLWMTYASLLDVADVGQRAKAYTEELTRVIKQPVCTTDHPHGNDRGEMVARRKEMYDRFASRWETHLNRKKSKKTVRR